MTKTFPVGIISALAAFGNDRRMIQISTPVQPGNSGSPLLDQSGNVVGIVSGELNTIQVAETRSETTQNVNFAVNCQSASDRDPRSASKRDPFVLRFERLALAPSELVGVAETARTRVVV
jgi:S1-C subfamily serine protease